MYVCAHVQDSLYMCRCVGMRVCVHVAMPVCVCVRVGACVPEISKVHTSFTQVEVQIRKVLKPEKST